MVLNLLCGSQEVSLFHCLFVLFQRLSKSLICFPSPLFVNHQQPSFCQQEDFEFIVIADGQFKGMNAVCLKSTHLGQKGNTISLRNHTIKNKGNRNSHVPFPEVHRDLLCLYNMIKRVWQVSNASLHLLGFLYLSTPQKEKGTDGMGKSREDMAGRFHS